jgi:hypothetical protein
VKYTTNVFLRYITIVKMNSIVRTCLNRRSYCVRDIPTGFSILRHNQTYIPSLCGHNELRQKYHTSVKLFSNNKEVKNIRRGISWPKKYIKDVYLCFPEGKYTRFAQPTFNMVPGDFLESAQNDAKFKVRLKDADLSSITLVAVTKREGTLSPSADDIKAGTPLAPDVPVSDSLKKLYESKPGFSGNVYLFVDVPVKNEINTAGM